MDPDFAVTPAGQVFSREGSSLPQNESIIPAGPNASGALAIPEATPQTPLQVGLNSVPGGAVYPDIVLRQQHQFSIPPAINVPAQDTAPALAGTANLPAIRQPSLPAPAAPVEQDSVTPDTRPVDSISSGRTEGTVPAGPVLGGAVAVSPVQRQKTPPPVMKTRRVYRRTGQNPPAPQDTLPQLRLVPVNEKSFRIEGDTGNLGRVLTNLGGRKDGTTGWRFPAESEEQVRNALGNLLEENAGIAAFRNRQPEAGTPNNDQPTASQEARWADREESVRRQEMADAIRREAYAGMREEASAKLREIARQKREKGTTASRGQNEETFLQNHIAVSTIPGQPQERRTLPSVSEQRMAILERLPEEVRRATSDADRPFRNASDFYRSLLAKHPTVKNTERADVAEDSDKKKTSGQRSDDRPGTASDNEQHISSLHSENAASSISAQAATVNAQAGNSTPADPFGTAHTAYSGKPKEAIEYLLKVKEGHVPAAFHKEGLGDIDLPWGKGGKKGFGLAHIIERRNADGLDSVRFVHTLSEIIRKGRVEHRENYPNRAYIVHDDNESVIRLEWDGKRRCWLLTAYPLKKEKPQSSSRTTDFGQTYVEEKAPSSSSEAVKNSISAQAATVNAQAGNSTPADPFGTAHTEYSGKPKEAIEYLLKVKEGMCLPRSTKKDLAISTCPGEWAAKKAMVWLTLLSGETNRARMDLHLSEVCPGL